MKKVKGGKGITLIALVITVIVLLILAGITILAISGENGIIQKAIEARENTESKEEIEKINLAVNGALATDLVDGNAIEDKTLRNEITNIFGTDSQLTGTGPWTFIGKNKKYIIETTGEINTKIITEPGTLAYMYEKAEEDGCTNLDGNCQNEEHLHKGDYVSLKTSTNGEISIPHTESGLEEMFTEDNVVNTFGSGPEPPEWFKTEQIFKLSNNQFNWRVLGETENGEVELISDNCMTIGDEEAKMQSLYLYGAKGALNGVDILNKVCLIYKTYDETGYIQTSRSLNVQDINKLTGYEREEDWKNYEFENQYTPQSYLEGKTVTIKGKDYYYEYLIGLKDEKNIMPMYEEVPSAFLDERVGNMIFIEGHNNLLATNSIRSSNNFVKYGVHGTAGNRVESLGLFDSDGSELPNYDIDGVRPVIILKHEVTPEQVPKIPDIPNDQV